MEKSVFPNRLPMGRYELFQGLTDSQIETVRPMLEERRYKKGTVLLDVGAPAENLFLVANQETL